MLYFVEDPVSRYIGGSGGMEDSVLVYCIGSALGFAQRGMCDFWTKSIEEGEKCNGISININSTASLWKPAFMATLVE